MLIVHVAVHVTPESVAPFIAATRENARRSIAEPGRYFAADSVGTGCVGCVADLVVLDADPTQDIGNTRRISLVVSDGRVYSPAARQSLLDRALRAARPESH